MLLLLPEAQGLRLILQQLQQLRRRGVRPIRKF